MKGKITFHDINKKQYKESPKNTTFRPSVYGILIENDKILLSKQWDGYDFPGGGVNIDETLEEALCREFFEETGLKIKVKYPIHCETSFFTPRHSEKNKKQYWNCPLIYFLVEKSGGSLSKDNLDEDEKKYADLPEWIDLNKIKKIKFYNSVHSPEIIQAAQSKNLK